MPSDFASPSATASHSASAISNCASIRARLGTGVFRARISRVIVSIWRSREATRAACTRSSVALSARRLARNVRHLRWCSSTARLSRLRIARALPPDFRMSLNRRPLGAHPVLVNVEKDRELVGEVNIESAGGIAGLARDAVRIGAVIAVRIENPGGGLDQRAPRLSRFPMPLRFASGPRLRRRGDRAQLPGDASTLEPRLARIFYLAAAASGRADLLPSVAFSMNGSTAARNFSGSSRNGQWPPPKSATE